MNNECCCKYVTYRSLDKNRKTREVLSWDTIQAQVN